MVKTVGVLSLQGGVPAHLKVLSQLGVTSREVKHPHDLEGLDGLILPGGESTTMLKMLNATNLFEPVQAFCATDKPILGTCAGAILLASTVRFRNQSSLGVLPVEIDRNVYGAQANSFRATFDCPIWDLFDIPAFFIRAPRFAHLGKGVQVLSRLGKDITGVVYRNITAITYHPELADDTRFHKAWLERADSAEDPS